MALNSDKIQVGWTGQNFPLNFRKPNKFHLKVLTFVRKMRGHLLKLVKDMYKNVVPNADICTSCHIQDAL